MPDVVAIAYYECGGAADLHPGELARSTCPHDGCDADLDHIKEL